MAEFDDSDIDRLMGDAGIVRSRAKIAATIGNARVYRAMRDSGEDFGDFVWTFVENSPVIGDGVTRPTQSTASLALSKSLKSLGFTFVGPVIVYAWMQACSLIDDHERRCFRRTGQE